ncbi:LysR family transcriptional regulator [Sphingomonas sp. S2M10]|uniref:LysR substrate-binding domain-containing protein n=1 Tax=Sphingomonas sp. S2M10 TaxID=2705010 RepID=UPI0032B3367C
MRHLRYMIAAAEHGSFRRAAAALGVESSAVSRRIRDLEDSVGASLFSRYAGGVRLNEAGERFLHHARQALGQIDAAGNHAATIGRGESGTVRIGILDSFASTFVTELLQGYDTRHPGIRLDYVEKEPAGLIAAIRQRQIDIAFLIGIFEAPGCEIAQLWNERVYIAMAEADDLTRLEAIGWPDIKDRRFVVTEVAPGPQITDYLRLRLAMLGASPIVERQAVYRDTLMQIVAGGQQVTLVIESYTAMSFPGVVYRRLGNEVIPLCAVWSPANENPAFRRLLSLAKAFSKKYPARLAKADGEKAVRED